MFYWVTSEPAHGTVTFDPMTGQFTYVANPGSPGSDSFTYTVYDTQTQGNEATVQVGAGDRRLTRRSARVRTERAIAEAPVASCRGPCGPG